MVGIYVIRTQGEVISTGGQGQRATTRISKGIERRTLVDVWSLSVKLLGELLRRMSLDTESLADSENLEEVGHVWTKVSDDFGTEVGGRVGSDDGREEG